MRVVLLSLGDETCSPELWGQVLGCVSPSRACDAEVGTESEGHPENTCVHLISQPYNVLIHCNREGHQALLNYCVKEKADLLNVNMEQIEFSLSLIEGWLGAGQRPHFSKSIIAEIHLKVSSLGNWPQLRLHINATPCAALARRGFVAACSLQFWRPYSAVLHVTQT